MTWEAWLTLCVLTMTVGALAKDALSPAYAVLGASLLLLVVGVITPEQAFAGFSNPAPITVAALYVLARAVEVTGAMEPVVGRLLGRPPAVARRRGNGLRGQLIRLVGPIATGSAVLNNTPIVAMVAPEVVEWARRHHRSASPLLMPVSFAAILGGVVTVIGTSTNLVVSGLLDATPGQAPIGMFEISRVGLPVAIVGSLVLVLAAPRLLPDRRGDQRSLTETAREFSVAMEVVSGGQLDGRSVEDGGLRHLQGVYCVQVERGHRTIAPVGPDEVLRGGDVLVFVGQVDLIVDLQRKRGLTSLEGRHLDGVDDRRQEFLEAVIGTESPLSGRTLRQADFRARYQAAVLAIHRAGQRVDAKLGDVTLRPGDTLLLLAGEGFSQRWRETGDFLVIAPIGGHPPGRLSKAPLVAVITVLLVVVAGSGLLPILQTSLLAAVALVAFRVLTPREARDAVDLNVIVVIAAAFGVAAAIETTGLARVLGDAIVSVFAPLGGFGALLGVFLATLVLTELITNNAAAALMFPIALSTAQAAGANARAFAMAVAIAASASFLTPIGYQTNTIVFGLGGYRFTDYVRLGLPLTVAVTVVAMVVIPLGWPL